MRIRILGAMILSIGVALVTVHGFSAPEAPDSIEPPDVDGPIGELIRNLVLEAIPHEYEDTRDWGGTKRVWDGLKIEVDGLRIKTKRRWKDARHGTWKRYRVWLIDPDEEFQIHIENARKTPSDKIAFDLIVEAQIGAFARLSEFRRDVQLISLSINADAVVRMRLGCELSAEFGFSNQLAPQVTLNPHITSADLQLIDFEVHRLSQISGSVAEELGDGLHKILQKQIDDKQGKLVEKANRAIAKNHDHLTLSILDVASSGWEKLMGRLRK